MTKYKVHELAKDFALQTKDILDILAGVFGEKKSQTSLEEEEIDYVFDAITQQNQVKSFDAYFAKGDEARSKRQEQKAKEKEELLAKQAAILEQLKAAQMAQKAEQTPAPEKEKPAAKPAAKPPVKEKPAAEKPKAEPKEKKPAEPNLHPFEAKKKKENPGAAPNRGPAEIRKVDTRASHVDLDKYNEKYENIAPAHAMKDNVQRKQKIKQKSQDYRRPQGAKRETEADKLRRLQLEKIKKTPIKVTVGDEVTVAELAAAMKKTVAEVIKCLIGLGMMATANQVIDYDTAEIVVTELGCKIERAVVVTIEERIMDVAEDKEEDLKPRDPIVVVMGHVDHGKTSLLDAIRNTNVTGGEAGGITQHIGAYRVNCNGSKITFLDTPGHAAFTSMRQRGAMATDIAVLVVAADDGIMPQTIEAINHARAAEVQMIVAINKMDKPEANPDRVLQQLTEHSVVPEQWGGDVICVPVSAKTHDGIDKLLENILLVSEMMELKANPDRKAKGTVIEARLDKGRGPVATLLVQTGTLHTGDIIVAGTSVGRVRVMTNENGKVLKKAGPSVPVEITGLVEVPQAGDAFDAASDERLARQLVEQRKQKQKDEAFKATQKVTLDNLFSQLEQGELKELSIIVKADVQGSVEAVRESLEKISNDEVRVRVIHGGVGAINESDIMLAGTSGAIVVGFNVRPDAVAKDLAERDGVDVRMYRVIYDCIEEIESAMKGMLAPKFREVQMGAVEVRETYKISGVGTIAGCYVTNGKVTRNCQIRVVRDGVVLAEDAIDSLRRFKDDVKEVAQGYECGIGLVKYSDIKVGDVLEAFIMEEYRD
ncbi:MAG: translation initiation factor IF-2 [Clostridia bacterium]|nr:translation initiation factor IF-2 [Clostridia bacterium]